MTARTKSFLLLTATLVVGLAVGALASSTVMHNRLDELERLRERRGFTERMEEVIGPVDAEQAEAVRAVLDASQARFDGARRSCRALFDEAGVTMRAELDPLLTDAQRDRLEAWMSRDRDRMRRRDYDRRRRGRSSP